VVSCEYRMTNHASCLEYNEARVVRRCSKAPAARGKLKGCWTQRHLGKGDGEGESLEDFVSFACYSRTLYRHLDFPCV
jgi:hypothetical protein